MSDPILRLSSAMTDVNEIRDFCMWIDNYNVPEAFEDATVDECNGIIEEWFLEDGQDMESAQSDYLECLGKYKAVVRQRIANGGSMYYPFTRNDT